MPPEEEDELGELPTSYYVVLYAFGAPISVAAAVGNTLLVIAIIRFAKLRTKTNVVVANLGVADMLGGLILLTHIAILHKMEDMGEESPYACHLWAALQLLPMMAGFLHLALVSIDRLVAVTRAVDYDDSMSASRMKVYASCLWIYIVLITALSYAFMDHDNPQYSICDLLILDRVYVMIILFGHVVPCCLINLGIFAWLRHTLKVHQCKIQVTNTMTYNKLVADYSTAKLFFTTFVVTTILWLPFLVVVIVWFAGVDTQAVFLAVRLLHLLGCLSHNKYIIYAMLDVDFKKAIKKAVSCSRKPPPLPPKRPSIA